MPDASLSPNHEGNSKQQPLASSFIHQQAPQGRGTDHSCQLSNISTSCTWMGKNRITTIHTAFCISVAQ